MTALFVLTRHFQHGAGVERDHETAMAILDELVTTEDSRALHRIGELH